MANHQSAIKRHRKSRKLRTHNRAARSRLHSMTRELHEAIAAGNKQQAQERLREISMALSKAAAKGLLHSSNASRRTSRLARRVAALGA